MLQGRQDLPTFQGNTSWMLPIPATFVVGRDGLIRARFIDPDYRKPIGDRRHAHGAQELTSARVTRPVGGAQHLENGRSDRRTLPSGDAIEVDGSVELDLLDGRKSRHKPAAALPVILVTNLANESRASTLRRKFPLASGSARRIAAAAFGSMTVW